MKTSKTDVEIKLHILRAWITDRAWLMLEQIQQEERSESSLYQPF